MDIAELNKQNAYSDKVAKAQLYVRNNYKSMSAKEIHDIACKINSYNRPTSYCIIHLHFGLIELVNLIYKLRDTDSEAIDYCLKICDMDIALYDTVRIASIKESGNDFVYTGALQRKIAILEKRGEYLKAIELCDIAIRNRYTKNAHESDSSSFIAQKDRIKKKLDKAQPNLKNIISKPTNK